MEMLVAPLNEPLLLKVPLGTASVYEPAIVPVELLVLVAPVMLSEVTSEMEPELVKLAVVDNVGELIVAPLALVSVAAVTLVPVMAPLLVRVPAFIARLPDKLPVAELVKTPLTVTLVKLLKVAELVKVWIFTLERFGMDPLLFKLRLAAFSADIPLMVPLLTK
jgi:hypothetical protein